MRLAAMLLLPVVLALGGCATLNYDAPPGPMSFPASPKFPLHVQLRLSDELRQAEWNDQFRLSIGEALGSNCEALAKALFSQVDVIAGNAGVAIPGVSSLTPRLVVIARDRPATINKDQRTAIILEWTLSDPEGHPIWIETIQGDGHAALKSADKQVDRALKNLFDTSYRKMARSREIRAFAANANVRNGDVPMAD